MKEGTSWTPGVESSGELPQVNGSEARDNHQEAVDSTIANPDNDTELSRGEQFLLDRRLSAPARLKPSSHHFPPLSSDLSANQAIYERSSAPTTPRLSSNNCRRCAQNSFRHSTSLRHNRKCFHYHNRQSPHQQKSASPFSLGSSSASDSAFSRSQTTLDSISSENFRPSFFGVNNNKFDQKAQLTRVDLQIENKLREETTKENNLEEFALADPKGANHFELIWQNLSYRVPEKKLTRLVNRLGELYASSKGEKEPKTQSDTYLPPTINIEDGFLKINRDGGSNHGELGVDMDMDMDGSQNTSTTINKRRQVIFSNLNGCVKSGQLSAILGPSGAGKTTFLKCLTSSIVKGVSGRIDIINGSCCSQIIQTTSQQSKHLKLCIIPQKGESP